MQVIHYNEIKIVERQGNCFKLNYFTEESISRRLSNLVTEYHDVYNRVLNRFPQRLRGKNFEVASSCFIPNNQPHLIQQCNLCS